MAAPAEIPPKKPTHKRILADPDSVFVTESQRAWGIASNPSYGTELAL